MRNYAPVILFHGYVKDVDCIFNTKRYKAVMHMNGRMRLSRRRFKTAMGAEAYGRELAARYARMANGWYSSENGSSGS